MSPFEAKTWLPRFASGRDLLHRHKHFQRVVALLVNEAFGQPIAQRLKLVPVQALHLGRMEDCRPASVRKEQGLGDRFELHSGRIAQQARGLRPTQGSPYVDHRHGGHREARLGRTVNNRNFVVVFQFAIPKGLEDAPDPLHSVDVQLRSAQRAHAGTAQDRYSLGEGP
jgi:hypothetical protein